MAQTSTNFADTFVRNYAAFLAINGLPVPPALQGVISPTGYISDESQMGAIYEAINKVDPQGAARTRSYVGDMRGVDTSALGPNDTLTWKSAADENDWMAPVSLIGTAVGAGYLNGAFSGLGGAAEAGLSTVGGAGGLNDVVGSGFNPGSMGADASWGANAAGGINSFDSGAMNEVLNRAVTEAGGTVAQAATAAKAAAAGMGLKEALQVAGIAAPIAGAILGSSAIQSAAKAQAESANRANDTLTNQFNTTRADLAPWRDAGVNALNQLTAGTAPGGEFTKTFASPEFDFEADPGYQFRLAEGEKALERASAARGMRNSGAQYKDLLRFGQNTASNEYDKAFNRFDTNRAFEYNKFTGDQNTKFNRSASIAGIGQTAVNSLASSGANTANAVANNITGAGNVNAGATIAGVNALNSGIGSALSNYTNQTNNAAMLDYLKGRTPTVGAQ